MRHAIRYEAHILKFLFMIVTIGLWLVIIFAVLNQLYGGDDDGIASTGLRCDDCETVPVTRIIDGDTFVSGDTRIRLYGMDTPEVGERCADEATERLRQLAGDRVRVEAGPRSTDPFGRSLAYLYTESGASIDEALVREGLAVAWRRDGQHRDFLVGLEADVRENGTGCLWQ